MTSDFFKAMYRKNKTKAPALSSSLKPNEVDGNKNHNYTVMRFYLCGTHLTSLQSLGRFLSFTCFYTENISTSRSTTHLRPCFFGIYLAEDFKKCGAAK